MNRIVSWNPIMDKLRSKLSIQKAKTLSFGGRITFVKVVLRRLPTFFLSIFGSPIGVINSLEKIHRQFIQGCPTCKNSIHWVAWKKVTPAKSVGGLGIRSIRSLNLVLLTKWMWRLKNEPNSLWVLIINGLHKMVGENNQFCSKYLWSSEWKNIVKNRKMLEKINIMRKLLTHGYVHSLKTDSSAWLPSMIELKQHPSQYAMGISHGLNWFH